MIYGHPAPCLVTLIDGGPTVMVEPLRFIPVSELPLPRGSHLGQPGESAVTCSPGEQAGGGGPFSAPPATQNTGPRYTPTADTVRGCEGDAASVQKARGVPEGMWAPGSIAGTN